MHRVLVIDGHPDASGGRLCHALAAAYCEGVREAGHEVRTVSVANLEFPMLRSKSEWENGTVPASLADVQQDILWAQHVVFFFPLWLGDMPALLKAFLEQVARPGFALAPGKDGGPGAKLLKGRTARVVVTMGMPALVYRWIFRAHAVKSLERNILGFVGFGPVHETLVGTVDSLGAAGVSRWLKRMRDAGRACA